LHLVVGLGNPGERYAATRHNVGARIVELAAARWSVTLASSGHLRLGQGRIGETDVILSQPLAWMNASGPVVKALLEQAGLSPAQLIVIHDDLDLDLGRLRIRQRGGAGGHNGVLSILTALETDEFYRVKVGIGRPAGNEDPADFVLSPFTASDLDSIKPSMARAVEALECLVQDGPADAMNRFNARQESDMPDITGDNE
jgi:PTH1 family peptidyl-tRNA hydrolase